jgi:hypothetical protein
LRLIDPWCLAQRRLKVVESVQASHASVHGLDSMSHIPEQQLLRLRLGDRHATVDLGAGVAVSDRPDSTDSWYLAVLSIARQSLDHHRTVLDRWLRPRRTELLSTHEIADRRTT